MSLARSRARAAYERCIRRTAASGRGRKNAKCTAIVTAAPMAISAASQPNSAQRDVILDEEAEEGAHEREHAAHEAARAEATAVGADGQRDGEQRQRRHPDVHRQADRRAAASSGSGRNSSVTSWPRAVGVHADAEPADHREDRAEHHRDDHAARGSASTAAPPRAAGACAGDRRLEGAGRPGRTATRPLGRPRSRPRPRSPSAGASAPGRSRRASQATPGQGAGPLSQGCHAESERRCRAAGGPPSPGHAIDDIHASLA